MERDRLLQDVVQAATELHERKLWQRFTNFDCFGIRLAGVDEVFVASVMGDAGEQYGLMLFRGPHAMDSFAAMCDDGPGDDVVEAMDMLSFNIEAFGGLEPEDQAFFRQAGMHPRYDELVPCFLVKPANRRPRLPNEDELRIWMTVLKSVVLADRRKLLKAAGHDDERGICVIHPRGEPTVLTVEVAREKLPRPAVISGPHVFAASGLDLSGLKLLDATWLVGTPVMPGGVEGDDRSMQMLLVGDDSSGMILQARPFFSEDLREAVDALVGTFQGHQPNGTKGLPRTAVFSNLALCEAVGDALEKAGVKCIYDPAIPQLQEMAEEFLDFMEDGMGPADDDDTR